MLTLLRRVKPISQITAVTDALLPTKQEHGPFVANGEEIILAEGVWKRKTDGVTAGSALIMQEAFKQLIQAGYSVTEASQSTSANAANLLSLSTGKIQVGSAANLVLLSQDYTVQQVYLNGQII